MNYQLTLSWLLTLSITQLFYNKSRWQMTKKLCRFYCFKWKWTKLSLDFLWNSLLSLALNQNSVYDKLTRESKHESRRMGSHVAEIIMENRDVKNCSVAELESMAQTSVIVRNSTFMHSSWYESIVSHQPYTNIRLSKV